jgi:very-short-patch-repair endonuclease
MGMSFESLSAMADRHGLIYQSDVVPEFLSPSGWSRAILRGQIITIQPGVGLLRGQQRTDIQAVAAAVHASGHDAMAAGATAAWLHGVSLPLVRPIHVLTPTRGRHRSIVGAMLHRPLDHQDLGIVRIQDIATTSPFRTLLDTAAWNKSFTHRVLEHFLVTGDLTIASSWRHLFAHARQGRRGITHLRNTLNGWHLDTEQPESVLEAKMLALCFASGLPPFEFQAEVGPFRVDFLWRDERVIVECDGFAFHGSTRDAFERDRHRDAHLQSLGYTVWRFSFRQITNEPQKVIAFLREGFRRA